MSLPEWRPLPRHLKNDDDTQDAIAAFRLVGPVVLIAVGVLLLVLGLLFG